MKAVLITLIVLLAVHYVLAIATVYILLKDMGLKKAIIPWNIVILLIPVAGPLSYLVYRCFRKKKQARKSAEDLSNGHEIGREQMAATLGEDQGEQLQQEEHRQ